MKAELVVSAIVGRFLGYLTGDGFCLNSLATASSFLLVFCVSFLLNFLQTA